MTYLINCAVHFPATTIRQAFTIRKVNAIMVSSSWKNSTDTAIVKIASTLYFDNKKIDVNEYFKKGDKIEIQAGYNGSLPVLFTGYISKLVVDIPLEIHAEDAMYLFKKIGVNKIYYNATLKSILTEAVSKCNSTFNTNLVLQTVDRELGDITIKNSNYAQLFEKLKKEYNVIIYIRNNTLYAGKIYAFADKTTKAILHLQRNVKSFNIENVADTDYTVQVKAINHLQSGKKITATAGDVNGEIRTANYRIESVNTKEKLEVLAQSELTRYKQNGLQGDIILFGVPVLLHSDVVDVVSYKYTPNQLGAFFIESVETSLENTTGLQQNIKLGIEAV